MKQTIKIEIEVPEGYKAVFDRKTQRVELVDATLPKTWEEFCERTPVINEETYIDFYRGGRTEGDTKRDVFKDRALLPNYETAEAFLALMQLVQLRDCYRQGWTPDWTKRNDKYCILHINDGVGIEIRNYTSSVLSFQSAEIRDEFLKNFKDLIEQAKELI